LPSPSAVNRCVRLTTPRRKKLIAAAPAIHAAPLLTPAPINKGRPDTDSSHATARDETEACASTRSADVPRRLAFVEEHHCHLRSYRSSGAVVLYASADETASPAIAKARAVRWNAARLASAHALAMQTPGQESMAVRTLRVHGGSRREDGADAQARSSSNPYRSMEGGSVDELLGVTVERPVLDQLQVEVGRTLEDRVQPGLTGDDREERHLQAVD
jgi:hypothetical protein